MVRLSLFLYQQKNNMPKIRIAITDDHQIIIDGLVSLLSKYNQLSIVLTTNSAAQMLEDLAKTEVDILLTDVMMPGMSGSELAKKVRQLYPSIKIIALSMSGQAQTVSNMIEDADIAGYLLKQTNAGELAAAIQKVYAGGIYFQEDILQELEKLGNKKSTAVAVKITNREKQLIELIEKDYSSKEIAAALNISLHTVETHRKNIMRKTGTGNVLLLVKWAYENKVLSRE
ncbi:MAG: response regulator transcription factor [Sphingobacteriales bacterium]|nr:MAG: response regulator transcription factor [Sphingobacteriales bacterium]